MRTIGYLLLLLVLALVATRPVLQGQKQPDKLPGLKELLVGKWQAQAGEDGEVMEFKANGACIMSIKGQPLGNAVYKIIDRDTLIISSTDGEEIDRFQALLYQDELSLIQTAKFKRMK